MFVIFLVKRIYIYFKGCGEVMCFGKGWIGLWFRENKENVGSVFVKFIDFIIDDCFFNILKWYIKK